MVDVEQCRDPGFEQPYGFNFRANIRSVWGVECIEVDHSVRRQGPAAVDALPRETRLRLKWKAIKRESISNEMFVRRRGSLGAR
jgi:hypothetical protein